MAGDGYVTEPNRRASMLFDADPQSTVLFVDVPGAAPMCVQTVRLDRVRYDAVPTNVLSRALDRNARPASIRAAGWQALRLRKRRSPTSCSAASAIGKHPALHRLIAVSLKADRA